MSEEKLRDARVVDEKLIALFEDEEFRRILQQYLQNFETKFRSKNASDPTGPATSKVNQYCFLGSFDDRSDLSRAAIAVCNISPFSICFQRNCSAR